MHGIPAMLSNAYGMFYVAKSIETNAVLAHMYCVYTALCGYVYADYIFSLNFVPLSLHCYR